MNRALEGGCQVPIGSYAVIETADNGEQSLFLRGLVGAVDGSEILHNQVRGDIHQGEVLGNKLAQSLLKQGADIILQKVYADQA